MRGKDPRAADRCKVVGRIDEFWSYSRHGNHWLAFFNLMLYYNGVPSLLAGFATATAAAMILAAAVPEDVVPSQKVGGLFCLLPSLITSLLVLIFWHSRRMIFIDQACISQDDDTMKRNGILSLGYFLKSSDTMVILWDPTYFTRLWCVFEFAAYLKLRTDGLGKHGALVLPSHYGVTTFLALFATLLYLVFDIAAALLEPDEEKIETSLLEVTMEQVYGVAVFAFLLAPLARPVGTVVLGYANQMSQLQAFTTNEAKCFCCSVSHCHPETRVTIDCDRKLIEGSVREWFGTVDAFDGYVRSELQKHIHSQACLPYRYVIFSLLPVIWLVMGEATWLLTSAHGHDHRQEAFDIAIKQLTQVFILSPVQWSLIWKVFGYFFRAGTSRGDVLRLRVYTFLCTILVYFPATLLWMWAYLWLGLYGSIPLVLIYGGWAVVFYR